MRISRVYPEFECGMPVDGIEQGFGSTARLSSVINTDDDRELEI